MLAPRKRVTVIVNPVSGGGRGRDQGREVARLLSSAGCEVAQVETEARGHAETLSREAVLRGTDVVLACGGDGTVSEVVQGLAGTQTALAVLPMGTANVLGHELELGRTAQKAAALVLRGKRRRLDLGRCAGRYLICMGSVGFDAFVTKQVADVRETTFSYLSYVGVTWQAIRKYRFEPLRVRVDGVALDATVYHLIIGNLRGYGGPFMMTPRAKPDDGLLDGCAFCSPGRLWLAAYMAATIVHVHHRYANVLNLRGRTFEVDADGPAPVQLDGDFIGHTPVTFEIVPDAVAVLSNR